MTFKILLSNHLDRVLEFVKFGGYIVFEIFYHLFFTKPN